MPVHATLAAMKGTRVMVVGLVVAGLAACGSSTGTKTSVAPSIGGQLLVAPADNTGLDTTDGSSCTGVGGYSDLNQGAQATLTDETGRILATGHLSAGTAGRASSGLTCMFTFGFGPVDQSAKFYSVQVGSRGKVTDSATDLKAAGWQFKLTIGQ